MRGAIELLESIAGRRLETVQRPPAAGDPRRTAADTTRIRAELGWQPETRLEEGLRAQWEWASARVAAR
jgi:nucleoside-diphosphate-sugar epimerase